MIIPGGYHPLTVTQLANVLHAIAAGQLTWAGARVWFACAEMLAIRLAAHRSRHMPFRKREGHFEFTRSEIVSMTGLAPRVVARSLSRLEKLTFLGFSSSRIELLTGALPEAEPMIQDLAGGRSALRPVPVPRRVLQHLAQLPTGSEGRVIVGYVCRGMTLEPRSGGVRHRGTVKASWLAETLGLSLRAVRYARESLQKQGWIGKDVGSKQLKLNRDGSWFEINLDWKPSTGIRVPTEAPVHADRPAVGAQLGIGVAPRTHRTGTPIAPPIENKKTPSELKDQRTSLGVFKPESKPRPPTALPPPTLRDIRVVDLRDPDRLRALLPQAVARGWIRDCPADRLNFFAAAARARSTVTRDPVRVFVWLVRGRNWTHITQVQEDEGRRLFGLGDAVTRRPTTATRPDHVSGIVGAILVNLLPANPSQTQDYTRPTAPLLPYECQSVRPNSDSHRIEA